jgi:hypothetical protein
MLKSFRFVAGQPFPEIRTELCIDGGKLRTVKVTSAKPDWSAFFDKNPSVLRILGPQFFVTTEGYLAGKAATVSLSWKCKTTIPDHKRILCEQSGSRRDGPDPDVQPSFTKDRDQKIMYYPVEN